MLLTLISFMKLGYRNSVHPDVYYNSRNCSIYENVRYDSCLMWGLTELAKLGGGFMNE